MSVYRSSIHTDHDYGPIALTILIIALVVRAWRKVFMAGSAIGYGLWYQHAGRIAAGTPQTVSDVMDSQIQAFAEATAQWGVSHPDIAMAVFPVLFIVYIARKWYRVEPYLIAWFDAPLETKVVQLLGLAVIGGGYWWLLAHGYVQPTGAY